MANIFHYIAWPFGYLMKFCCWISPGNNYLIALILFTIIIQLLLCLLFGIKQQKNMIKQASLAPKVAAIRKKYAGRNDNVTMQKVQQETQELYKENGYSPLGGCLPMLVQLPIVMALYYVIVYPMQYICMLDKEIVSNIIITFRNLSEKSPEIFEFSSKAASEIEKFKAGDALTNTRMAQVEVINQVAEWREMGAEGAALIEKHAPELTDAMLPDYSVGSLDFSYAPPLPGNDDFSHLWLLLIVPILIVATTILSQWLTKKFSYQDPSTKEAQNNCSMKVMMYSMPLLSAWISFTLPAAVGVYWIYRSVVATLQQFILSKLMPMPKFTEEDYKAAEKELTSTKRRKKNSESKPYTGEKKRSLHHIDDEEDETPALEAKAEEVEEPSITEQGFDPADAPAMKEDKGTTKYKKRK